MEVVSLVFIESGLSYSCNPIAIRLPENDADALKHAEVLTIYEIYIYIYRVFHDLRTLLRNVIS